MDQHLQAIDIWEEEAALISPPSTFILGPEGEGFPSFCPDPFGERLCQFSMGLEHWSLS